MKLRLTRALRISLFMALLVLFAPRPGFAAWVLDGVPVSSTNGSGYAGAVVADGAGGTIVVWQDNWIGNYDIYAQRYDGFGVPQWGPDGVGVCRVVNDQTSPVAVSDGAGGAIIAWLDMRNGGGTDIYAQRLDPSGTALWTADGVALCTATGNQLALSIASDGAGGAILGWQDARSGTNWDVYALRVDATGTPQWGADGAPVCTLTSAQTRVEVVTDGANGAIVSWDDGRAGNSDIYAQHLDPFGMSTWAVDGSVICSATNDQNGNTPVADGSGGAVIAWTDYRSDASGDIYAQRTDKYSMMLWGQDGVPICQETDVQSNQAITTDGNGGAIIAWQDGRAGGGEIDLYAQHVNGYGGVMWMAGGTPVSQVAGTQEPAVLQPDGTGGAYAVWPDDRGGLSNIDIFAEHLDASGASRWQTDGIPVTLAANNQNFPVCALDGDGGLVTQWTDNRSGAASHPYLQRLDLRYGYWGRPEPTIVSATDNPHDQGGKVILRWAASDRDRYDMPGISSYSVWRSTDAVAAQAAGTSPVTVIRDPALIPKSPTGRLILETHTANGAQYWEWLATLPAVYQATYSYTAATRQDSTLTDPSPNYFKVIANEYDRALGHAWESGVVSAHSVDNLAPAPPLQLTGDRTGSGVILTWKSGGTAPDFDHYKIYRSGLTAVTPVPTNVIATSTDPSFVDAAAPGGTLHYIVSAIDTHGNESAPSNMIGVYGTTSVGDHPSPAITALTVLPNRPNPFGVTTSLQVGLPSASDVSIEVYDVAGRRVRTLSEGSKTAGWQSVPFDGRDDAGDMLPSGVYFYRVHAGAATVTRKMVIAR